MMTSLRWALVARNNLNVEVFLSLTMETSPQIEPLESDTWENWTLQWGSWNICYSPWI